MRIACIGWGSLTWDPGKLPIKEEWQKNGPLLPIEFARESLDQRITLVIVENSLTVTTLWVEMTCLNLDSARESLRIREGTMLGNIHSVCRGERPTTSTKVTVLGWLNQVEFDCAIWTGLNCKFKNRNIKPTAKEVVRHLKLLNNEAKLKAEEYVRKTPKQIGTKYRSLIESELGWTPLE